MADDREKSCVPFCPRGLSGGMLVPIFEALATASTATQLSVIALMAGMALGGTNAAVNDAIAQGNQDLVTYRFIVGYLSLLMIPFGARMASDEGLAVMRVPRSTEPIEPIGVSTTALS